MGNVSWDEVDPRPEGTNQSGGGGGKFLKLEPGNEYRIRPVGCPSELKRYYVRGSDNKLNVVITDAGSDCVILRKYRNADGEPEYDQRVRYAFNILDRNDSDDKGMSRLKVVEVAPTIARSIRDWGKANSINPGSGKGTDFTIKVTRKTDDPRSTRYEVIPMVPVPFTDQEKTYLQEHGAFDLEELFKPTSQDNIEEALGLGGASRSAQAVSTGSGNNANDLDF